MATKVNRFLVGIFVITGIIIGVAIAIWLGATKYLEKTSMYTTYFDESVSGLNRDGPVKYRGVAIGRVNNVSVAPDGRLVEVELSISPELKITPDIRARLKSAGITGIMFIELDQKRPNMEGLTLSSNYKTPYPMIPSEPSDLKEIWDNLSQALDHISKLDLKGISDSIKSTLNSVDELMGSEKWVSILNKFDSTSGAIERAANHMETIISKFDVEKTVASAQDMLEEGRLLLVEARKQIQSLKLEKNIERAMKKVEKISDEVETLASNLDQRTGKLSNNISGLITTIDQQTIGLYKELSRMAYDLQKTAENLKLLTESLRDRPSRLIFDQQPEPRR